MVAGCGILVGISYLMLDILSNMVVVPQTPVREVEDQGEMVIALPQSNLSSMQVSAGGRFLAFIHKNGQGSENTLQVRDIKQNWNQVFSQAVRGQQLAWLGSEDTLLYEDRGDIMALNLATGISRNLTESAEYDTSPLPSPNGTVVMWTRMPVETGGGAGEFWLMEADGGKKRMLVTAGKMPVWDPSGDTILARRDIVISPDSETYRYFLETVRKDGGGWNHYAECDREPLYVWWPGDSFFYIAPYETGGEGNVKGVWFRVDSPTGVKRVASTTSLAEISYYRFCASRKGQKLAYVGGNGLEYLDMQERVISRFRGTDARLPLAWDEASGYLYYAGEAGIYRVSLQGGES
ncbi:MAG: hypothetical protein A2Y75_00650 [Candidatus Solincola sediminis]|uniref:Dipeptidylpeptidase IV N-terminal domain-containing protein n=1 Tax=Candidatus Solincola sediminis TaxID=1797199 RepID=A0A1F2WQA9_9ACTN|nr:MAG: hypothetical protein A2Y75_00650 [Candidatus Solincola sediminis]